MSRNVGHSSEPWLFGEGEKGWWTGEEFAAGRVPAERAPRGDAAGPPYLETNRNTVDKPAEGVWPSYGGTREGEHYECRAMGCRCRFCPHCCKHLALKLRERLVPVLKSFAGMLMLTLTIDPKLFASPEDAYWYCRERRVVAELVRALRKAGYVKSRRFFYVVEWHKSGWAHFHVLVESAFIPFGALAELWGRNRPDSAPAWEGSYAASMKGQAPEFGTVRISKRDFASPEHAVNYALKYMMKLPEQGFPDWVLDSERQIRMFSTSRGLLPAERPAARGDDKDDASDADLGSEAMDAAGADESPPADAEPFGDMAPAKRTIRERLERCGKDAAILRVSELRDDQGTLVRVRRSFWRRLEIPFMEALQVLGCEEVRQRWVRLRDDDLARLAARRGPGQSVVGGGVNVDELAREALFDDWNARGGVV